MVLNELPITAPPRAVICCADVTAAINSSIPRPASIAELPTRLTASAKSLELTANAASTAANLLTKVEESIAAAEKEFNAAVIASTDSAAFKPDNLVKIKAS